MNYYDRQRFDREVGHVGIQYEFVLLIVNIYRKFYNHQKMNKLNDYDHHIYRLVIGEMENKFVEDLIENHIPIFEYVNQNRLNDNR
jgi:hypothetical protein